MHKSIDAATVSTPDHIHAPAAAMAMRRGIHCFVQKPLAQKIEWDAANMRVKNVVGMEALIKRKYRKGYEL